MKALKKIEVLRAGKAFILTVFTLVLLACSCEPLPPDPINNDELPKIGNLTVVQVVASSALVKAEIISDGSSAITEAGICWREGSAIPTVLSNAVAVDEKKGSFNATVSTLQPNTKYTLRAYAKNKVGVAYSDTVSLVTKNMTYLPTIKTVSAVESTPGNVLVTSEVVFDGGSLISETGVCW